MNNKYTTSKATVSTVPTSTSPTTSTSPLSTKKDYDTTITISNQSEKTTAPSEYTFITTITQETSSIATEFAIKTENAMTTASKQLAYVVTKLTLITTATTETSSSVDTTIPTTTKHKASTKFEKTTAKTESTSHPKTTKHMSFSTVAQRTTRVAAKVNMCSAELDSRGFNWPVTSPDTDTFLQCPAGHTGTIFPKLFAIENILINMMILINLMSVTGISIEWEGRALYPTGQT